MSVNETRRTQWITKRKIYLEKFVKVEDWLAINWILCAVDLINPGGYTMAEIVMLTLSRARLERSQFRGAFD